MQFFLSYDEHIKPTEKKAQIIIIITWLFQNLKHDDFYFQWRNEIKREKTA